MAQASIFGTDLWGVTDMDPAGAEVTGQLLLSQAIVRRLTTPRGGLIDDTNYGYDLRQWLNADVGPADIAAIKQAISAECLKDQRITQAHTEVVAPTLKNPVMTVTIALTSGAGPFTLTLAVSAVSVTILSIG